MTWKTDERHRKTFGSFSMVPERNDANKTAHLVTLTDQTIRVLPDAHSSGQKRSRTITEALKTLENLDPDPKLAKTILIGALAEEGMSWEHAAGGETTIEEWLEANWDNLGTWKNLLHDLADDGWEIVRVAE